MQSGYFNENGVALLLTIWVLALLSVIVGEFCHAMRTEVNITRNFKEKTEAYYIGKAGIMQAVVELIRIETTPPVIVNVEETQPLPEEEKIEWRINIPMQDIPFGAGAFSVKIENEAGKININKADQNLLRMMLNSFELDDNEKDIIVDSILDWRDKDDLRRMYGAEDEYYQSLAEPYHARNDDFESVEELLLVRGITPEIYNGRLKDIVSVYTEKDDIRPFRSRRQRVGRNNNDLSYNKININYASQAMLLTLPQMTEELVREIINFRKEKDLTMPDVLEIVGAGAYTELAPYITTSRDAKSPFFTIVSEGKSQLGGTITHHFEVTLKIDARSEKKYKILKWTDRG
jgi:general secretion pathway protein K